MQKHNKKSIAGLALLVMLSTTFLSFSLLPGGDVCEIYINKNLVLQKHITQMTNVGSIKLRKNDYNDKINVWYGHCGLSGKSRKIIIKSIYGNVLKQMSFADGKSNGRSIMSFSVKSILDLQKADINTLNMYYLSKELPTEKLLASVNISD